MSRLLSLVALFALLLLAWPAQARLTRGVSVDTDVESAARVFVGTVTEERVVDADAPGPFESRVAVLELNVLVDVPITNSKAGEDVTVRHLRVLPSSAPAIDGFGPVELAVGQAYLFFLQIGESGALELVAMESSIVGVAPTRVPGMALAAKKQDKPLGKALAVLLAATAHCDDTCAPAVWLLGASQALALDKAATRKRRRELAQNLVRVVRTAADENTLLAAYTELGRQSITSVIPRIVRVACQDPKSTRMILSNVINWLQGFKPAQRIRALKQIVAHAKDQDVIGYAKRQLASLEKRP